MILRALRETGNSEKRDERKKHRPLPNLREGQRNIREDKGRSVKCGKFFGETQRSKTPKNKK